MVTGYMHRDFGGYRLLSWDFFVKTHSKQKLHRHAVHAE